MKTLNGSRRDLIDALVAESDWGGITANLLEKDDHLTDALRALFSLKLNGLQLAQHHAGHMAQAWDTALVRHIYDVHCICTQHPDLMTSARAAFRLCLDEDKDIFKMQHPAFYNDATAVLRQALMQAKGDAQTHLEYTHNLLPLIYGNDKPSFAQAFASFKSAARLFLDIDSVPNQT